MADSLIQSFGVVQRLRDRRLVARVKILLIVDVCRWAMLMFSGVTALILVDWIGVPNLLNRLSVDELRRLLLYLLIGPVLAFAGLSLFVAVLVGWPQWHWSNATRMHWGLLILSACLVPLQCVLAIPLMRVSIGVTSEPPPSEWDRAVFHFAFVAGIVLLAKTIQSIAHRMRFIRRSWDNVLAPTVGVLAVGICVIETSPQWSGSTQQAIDTAHLCNTFLVIALAAAFAVFELVSMVCLSLERRKLFRELPSAA